ncbi:DUF4363 family protein [Caproiciproducens galactitolivorans]|uniref:DUF4363 family protein n=1 Tax=Caproiciproducens galactitolivorans TaxID=642589 RepID=UPI0024097FF5|nr:DUF4363 family protein [Caproiciproducens galactitolivorans]
MKRIWASVIIFVFLVTICTIGTITTKKVSGQMTQTVSSAKEAAAKGDTDTALELSRKALSDWHNKHSFLCTFMPHSQLEAIDQTLSTLPMLCYYNAMDQFEAECDRAITQIMFLNESQLPSLANIL